MLQNSNMSVLQRDLENSTGRVFAGNYTPMVWELLKNTEDVEGLLKAIGKKIKTVEHVTEVKSLGITKLDDLLKNSEELR